MSYDFSQKILKAGKAPNLAVFYVDKNTEEKIEHNEDGFEDIFGYGKNEELCLSNIFRDSDDIISQIKVVGETGRGFKGTFKAVEKDGKELRIFIFAENTEEKIRISAFDITPIELAAEEIENQKRRLIERIELYKTAERISEGNIFIYSVEKDVMRVLIKQQCIRFGENRVEDFIKAEMYKKYISEEHIDEFKKLWADTLKTGKMVDTELKGYILNMHEPLWYEFKFTGVKDKAGEIKYVVGRFINITQEKSHLEKMERLIKTDHMTGLFNKTAAQESIKKYIEETGLKSEDKSCALMIIDIDNFKAVNDTYGHDFGDYVIEKVALDIKRLFRSSDIMGRIGGDEFMIFMKNITAENAEAKTEMFLNTINHTYKYKNKEMYISSSAGIAYAKTGNEDYEDLFAQADADMYKNKLNKRKLV